MKRGYLLPEGCKDLTEVLNSKRSSNPIASKPARPKTSIPPTAPLPPIIGSITVPDQMTVAELATALAQKPFRIVADLIDMGVFAGNNQQVDFNTISRVVRKYGLVAKVASLSPSSDPKR